MKCTSCALGQTAQQNCVASDENLDSSIMVIGEAPGEYEEYPFASRAGRYLRNNLGVEAYYTYVTKCSTPEGVKIPAKCSKTCRDTYLRDEIRDLKPKYILVVGGPATKMVLGKAKITEVNGQIFEGAEHGYGHCKIMPIFSPSAMLHDPSKEGAFKRTIQKFHDMLGGVKQTESKIEWSFLSGDKLPEFWEDFDKEEDFSYDIETTSLWFYRVEEKITSIAITFPTSMKTWVIVPQHWLFPRLKSIFRKLSSKPCGGHNVKFDNLWIWSRFGVTFQTCFDTMLEHYILDENQGHRLKEIVPDLLGVSDYDIQLEEKKGNTSDLNKLYNYNAKDSYYTAQLRLLFDKKLAEEPEVEAIYHKLMIPISNLFSRIERHGHFINLEKFEATRAQLIKDIDRSLKELKAMVGHEVNWNSPAQVARVLYQELELPCTVYTGTGAPSTSEDALVDIDHPVVKLLQDYRGYAKFLSTYIEGWEKLMVGPYLYTSTKLHGTVTGRFASRFHQVPRDGTIRNMVEAPPGYTHIQADYSQAELKVAATLSQDPELIRCYREGIDVHWRTAMEMIRSDSNSPFLSLVWSTMASHCASIGIPVPRSSYEAIDILESIGPELAIVLDKRWKEIRKYAKAINFGFLYGMGGRKFQSYAKLKYGWDISLAMSEAVRNSYFQLYASLPDWHERQRKLVRAQGYVHNLAGRKRRLPGVWSDNQGIRAEAERQAINSPVQGLIGDIKCMGMLALDQNTDNTLLLQKGEVHDSVLIWVKDEYLEESLPLIKSSLENPPLLTELGVSLTIPMTVDIEIGPWGAGETWRP